MYNLSAVKLTTVPTASVDLCVLCIVAHNCYNKDTYIIYALFTVTVAKCPVRVLNEILDTLHHYSILATKASFIVSLKQFLTSLCG